MPKRKLRDFTEGPHNVGTAQNKNFDKEVLQHDTPVLVDFWAPWCGPCKLLAPILEDVANELEGKVKVVKVNTDDNPETTVQYGIRSIPTLKLFVEGKVIESITGAVSHEVLMEKLNSHL
jgi:thioredoxin 1